jgi:TrmH family RNA methyltransferase
MYTLSNTKVKLYQSLKEKKFRKQHGLFLAEGKKVVGDGIEADIQWESILIRADFNEPDFYIPSNIPVYTCKTEVFNKIATQEQAEGIIGIARIELPPEWNPTLPTLAIYKINDPGNMGTLLRTALWFGIHQIVCDAETVELYNPKTVRATMGAIWSLQVHYLTKFSEFLNKNREKIIVADLSGIEISRFKDWKSNSILLLGSESNGLKGLQLPENHTKVSIGGSGMMESLNVGVAGGIMMYEWFKLGNQTVTD